MFPPHLSRPTGYNLCRSPSSPKCAGSCRKRICDSQRARVRRRAVLTSGIWWCGRWIRVLLRSRRKRLPPLTDSIEIRNRTSCQCRKSHLWPNTTESGLVCLTIVYKHVYKQNKNIFGLRKQPYVLIFHRNRQFNAGLPVLNFLYYPTRVC